jgi:hypothetical protein
MSAQDRKSTRLESDQFISYRLYDSENRVCDEGMAKTKDISRTGVAVENRTPMEVGSKIDLTLALTEEVVKISGVVRNSERYGDIFNIGIEFLEISDDEWSKMTKEFPELLK